jgi:hypothetical protein
VSRELLWAVTDGPAGTNVVRLPEDRSGARRLGAHRGGFWCSGAAGGCGGRLVLHAADGARPSFHHHHHHHPDDGDAHCRYTDRPWEAECGYQHLRYQRALTAWLAAQGHRPMVRPVRGRDGSTDLHVVVADVSHALEVQLTPLPDTLWRQRDDRSRARVRHVTWLYGPGAEAAAATEVAVRGVALEIRRHGAGLAVGVRDVADQVRWVRLAACRLDADGLHVPGTGEARALHARRTADRREAVRRVARRSTRPTPPGEGSPGERAVRCAPVRTPWVPSAPTLPFPG